MEGKGSEVSKKEAARLADIPTASPDLGHFATFNRGLRVEAFPCINTSQTYRILPYPVKRQSKSQLLRMAAWGINLCMKVPHTSLKNRARFDFAS
jgi:hypothetical protein